MGPARTGLLEWEESGETYANSYERLAGGLGDRNRRRSAGGGQVCRRRLQYADRQRLARGDDLLDQGRGAEASGKVSKVVVANRNGGPSEQIADIRNLISAGANIIIINPSDREALNPVIKQAADKGIVVVAVDQAVSAPQAYVLTNDQVEYAKLGAKWLFDKLGGKGSVVEMRGIDGVPADADRHEGFTEVLKNYPNIKVTSVFTGWALDKTAQATKDLLASGKPIDGIWTSGIDSTVVDAYKTAGKPFVPVVGADNNGFIGQLVDLKDKGLSGAAVSNPPAVGAAGLEPRARRSGQEGAAASGQDHADGLGQRQGPERAQGRVQSKARPLFQRRHGAPLYALHARAADRLQRPVILS